MVVGGGGTIIRQAKKVEDLPVHCAVKLEIVIHSSRYLFSIEWA